MSPKATAEMAKADAVPVVISTSPSYNVVTSPVEEKGHGEIENAAAEPESEKWWHACFSNKTYPSPFVENPYDRANWFSRATLWWLNPLIATGAKKLLDQSDMWAVPAHHEVSYCYRMFQEHWEYSLKHRKSLKLVVPLLHSVKGWFISSGISQGIYVTLQLLTPYLVEALIGYISRDENADGLLGVTNGYALAFMLIALTLVSVTVMSISFNLVIKVGLNVRNTCMDLVYRKALVLSSSAKQQSTVGQMVTLMSVDAERLFQAFMSFHWIWAAPVIIFVGMGLLINYIGISALAGAAAMLFFLFVQGYVAKLIGRARKDTVTHTQERVKLINDALQGVRVLKYNAWEDTFEEKVEAARKKEIYFFKRLGYIKAVTSALTFISPVAVYLATLVTFAYTSDEQLTVTRVFTTMAFINLIRMPMNFFPMTLASIMEAKVAADRLEKFFLLGEITPRDENNLHGQERGTITVKDAEYSWSLPGAETETLREEKKAAEKKDKKKSGKAEGKKDEVYVELKDGAEGVANTPAGPTIANVSVDIRPGQLVAVVGPVGSGKTSFISALLGQMHQWKGETIVAGRIAYASQEPWIQHATLRENILFQDEFDKKRYTKVIDAAQLRPDLAILPGGDETEIGERGINLSGGQKARVSLARALYRRSADIVLMDDPLSAVDAHVAKKIFHRAVLGLLAGKTRVLVLNSHYHFLKEVDQVVIIENGKVLATGKPAALAPLYPRYFNAVEDEESESSEGEGDEDTAPLKGPGALSMRQESVGTSFKASRAGFSTTRDDATAGKDESSQKLTNKEANEVGAVTKKTYLSYFNAMGSFGAPLMGLVIVMFILAQASRTLSDWWLSQWAEFRYFGPDSQDPYVLIYSGLAVVAVIMTLARSFLFIHLTLNISEKIHQRIFHAVVHAPVTKFFDITPLGRIVNRFSKDLDQVDAFLPDFMAMFLMNSFGIIAILIVCCFSSPYILIVFAPMAVAFYMVDNYFRRSSRELKRLESVSRSPIYSSFNETLHGLPTIRAYGMQGELSQKNRDAVNINTKNFFTYWMSSRWLAYRLDLLSALVIVAVSLLSVGLRHTVQAGLAGLALTYSLQLTGMLQWTVRTAIMVENSMTSTERVLEFGDLEAEGTVEGPQVVPEPSWPQQGGIKIENLYLRYRPELDLVLKGIDLEIRAGEKIGICGRTGAGKSSVIVALFRMVEADSGRILIDGLDIAGMPLKNLRSKLAIIPQDPVMFAGTIRDNLDPIGKYTDADLWEVLRRVHLFDAVSELNGKLSASVAEGGDNLSVGQRQLICIGRALLKPTKILVMDEATASVDTATDSLIQQTIRENFSDRTVLCIAHRLETVIDSDRIVVVENGKVGEVDHPLKLLNDPSSLFMQLASELGDDVMKNLRQLASGGSYAAYSKQ